MYNSTTFEDLRKKDNLIFIDLRSEIEYNKETIPGAINIPILSTDERTEVSIVYDNGEYDKAKEMALVFVSKKLPSIYRQIRDLSLKHNVVLFCFRGSMRSTVLFNLLKSMGLTIFKLDGGYKAYRKYVRDRLVEIIPTFSYININGFTGVGKTEILKELKNQKYNVLDLESLANHRGSSLGAAGLGKQPSQKMFESLLLDAFESFDGKYVFVESESSNIGKITIPKILKISYSESPHQIKVDSSIDIRISRIKKDYLINDDCLNDLENGMTKLERYIGTKNVDFLKEQLRDKNYDYVIENLILKYYDLNYAIKRKDFELKVMNDDITSCINEITNFYDKLIKQ